MKECLGEAGFEVYYTVLYVFEVGEKGNLDEISFT
jgi:hypothetical protein